MSRNYDIKIAPKGEEPDQTNLSIGTEIIDIITTFGRIILSLVPILRIVKG
ncbi:MAG: hypothetical protein OEW70_09195 [candidate division WOR-3 bacterium]|nr:hypothetical protein [candidate division WOR-3 bacterium]